MQDQLGLTTQEMQKILDSLGFEPKIDYLEVPADAIQKDEVTDTGTYTDDKGQTYTFELSSVLNGDTNTSVKIPIISGSRTTYQGGGSVAPPNISSKGGSCFVAGTLITTLTGFSPIEQIKQGDIVLSYNESLHQLEYSTVVQTMIHDVIEPIYTLYIKNEQLRVTSIHRFLISRDIFHSAPQ